MKPALAAFLFLLPLAAQVKFTQSPGKVDVTIDGKPFTTFYAGGEAPKPYLAPLRSAEGLVVTRRFPMEKIEGETRDHPHHRGLWFTHGDVNKIDFWMNEPDLKATQKTKQGTIKLDKLDKLKGGAKQGTIQATFTWSAPDGAALLKEARTMTFHAGGPNRVIDFDVTFTALADKVTFGDTKEGFFAIRLRDELKEQGGTGKMTNAEGKTGEKLVWGKASPWVDYSGTLEGTRLGVAIFDHPSNIVYPTYWHVRAYGLFAVNPFGLHDFMNDKTEGRQQVDREGPDDEISLPRRDPPGRHRSGADRQAV